MRLNESAVLLRTTGYTPAHVLRNSGVHILYLSAL
jgi:hypothetical protein